MIWRIVSIVCVAVGFHFFLAIRKGLNLDKEFLYKHAPGPCQQIYKDGGAEDLTDIGDGLVIVSSGVNFDGKRGSLKLLNVNTKVPTVETLRITNEPKNRKDFLVSPHGISTWRNPDTGALRLYVITHPADADVIEVFEYQADNTLLHVRSIRDPAFEISNDLIVVGKDQFYITRMMHFRTALGWYIDFLMLTWGKIFYYDGQKATLVWSGMYQPNGINMSPDQRTLYVSEVGKLTLWAFKRKEDNTLEMKWSQYLNSGIDNIEVDRKTGDLLIGAHPYYYMTYDLHQLFNFTIPGQVLKVKLNSYGEVTDVIEVYANDGSEITFTSSASVVQSGYDPRLVIGSVTSQLLVCDIKYIK